MPKDHWGYEKEEKPDIVEVVRCKYCRWGHPDVLLNIYWCDDTPHDENFFCANGRKADK